MNIHKTCAAFAIKNRISLGRDHNGHYYIRRPDLHVGIMSNAPSAESGMAMMRRFLRSGFPWDCRYDQ